MIYRATVTGTLAPSERETRNARWLTVPQIQALADRTAAYASGQISDQEFTARQRSEGKDLMEFPGSA